LVDIYINVYVYPICTLSPKCEEIDSILAKILSSLFHLFFFCTLVVVAV